MPHIQGVSREIVLLFPPTIDEYVSADNPVRFIDAFVDQLELVELGFERVTAAIEGRPGYHPADLLKLYIYGYLNRIRSSPCFGTGEPPQCRSDVVTEAVDPYHKTIADFRKVHSNSLRGVCREFTQVCKELELFGGELIAVDGSKFLAVNSRKRNFSTTKLKQNLQEVDEQIAKYLSQLDEQDAQVPVESGQITQALPTKLVRLQERKAKHEAMQAQLVESGETQISLTDPESRSMIYGRTTEVCYNVQTAVDSQHGLIVVHEVTNDVSDQAWLATMAVQAKETLAVEAIEVVADRGYYDGAEVKQCLDAAITPYVAKPLTSVNQNRGRYTKQDFRYDRERDVYQCPQGQVLEFRFDTVEQERHIRYYKTSACRDCPVKDLCTSSNDGRRITRWVDEHLLEAMAERVRTNRDKMKQRQMIVEHPYGTLKRGMNQEYFLCRGLTKVRAEMSLSILAYNLKRAINILGIEAMMVGLTRMKLQKA